MLMRLLLGVVSRVGVRVRVAGVVVCGILAESPVGVEVIVVAGVAGAVAVEVVIVVGGVVVGVFVIGVDLGVAVVVLAAVDETS